MLHAYIILYNILAASFLPRFCAFVLALCANVIGLRQACNNRLAPLVQSELLFCFSVRLTFVKRDQPTPALPKTDRDGEYKGPRQLEVEFVISQLFVFYLLLSGFSSFYFICSRK